MIESCNKSLTIATGTTFAVDVVGAANEPIGDGVRWGQLWVSNLTARTPTVSGTNFWVWDLPLGVGSQSIVAAVSDLAGNTTFATSTVTLGGVTNSSYTFNKAGNVLDVRYRATSFASRRLYYDRDIRHRLTQVRVGTSEIIESYGYDALNRRTWTASGSVTNWHVYDGAHVIADVDAAGNPVRSYTWGPGIDNLLAMTVHTGVTDRTYYALTDRLGTVHALADETGSVVESYRYDAWGRVLGVYGADGAPMEQSALGNRYLFQGREYSWAVHIGSWTGAGIYYFRNRWYDPVIGRWLSNDPIGIAGGLNQYVAFGNNPVNYGDPIGLCADEKTKSFGLLGGRVAAVIGVLVDVSLVWDTGGNVGIKLTGGIGTGVDVGVNPLKGVVNTITQTLTGKGSSFGWTEGTIYDQSGFGFEGHVGVLGGISFDPSATGDKVITGVEVGNIGGGVYGTGTFVIPIWNSAWKKEGSPDPLRIRALPSYGWRPY